MDCRRVAAGEGAARAQVVPAAGAAPVALLAQAAQSVLAAVAGLAGPLELASMVEAEPVDLAAPGSMAGAALGVRVALADLLVSRVKERRG